MQADRQQAAPSPEPGRRPTPPAPARTGGPSPAQALELQRAVGNRSAARILSRWAIHPDEKEKGKLVSDGGAADYLRFNVPLKK